MHKADWLRFLDYHHVQDVVDLLMKSTVLSDLPHLRYLHVKTFCTCNFVQKSCVSTREYILYVQCCTEIVRGCP